MELVRRTAAVLALSVVLVPLAAAPASANPVQELNCAVQDLLPIDNVQDCRLG